MLNIRQFSLDEIKEATNIFENVLGCGGEGIVYLGQISELGKVAVKRLKSYLIDFEEEIKIVSKIKHPHLVSLYGYCDESGEKILVYEYMENGSLSDFIKKKSISAVYLSWHQRLNICLGAARALQHLHTETEELPKGIIHRDIKPDNILLDTNWVAKVSDFGLCKLSHASQKKSTMVTLLKGTGGYYAPEYVKYGSITRKVDVYAFGVVLFEVLCRKMPWDRGEESYYRSEDEDLGIWARENVDPEIDEEISEDCLEAFTHIIWRSLQQDPNMRPTIDDVVTDLECALKFQECQDKGSHPKASASGRKVSIPGSVRKMIQNIEEITGNSEDEIYEMLKECSMDPFQTMKLLFKKAKEVEVANENAEGKLVHFDEDMVFTSDDLLCATAEIVGKNAYGTIYKATLDDGNQVAVRRLREKITKNQNEFEIEVNAIGKIRYPNLLAMRAYYLGPKGEKLLVFDYMPKGNLATFLHARGPDMPIDWPTRMKIAKGVSRGLLYLHSHENIILGNLTSSKVLLDESNNAKIADYGLSRLMTSAANSDAITNVRGLGYKAPELSKVKDANTKTDVYSLGVIILELLTGKSPIIDTKGTYLARWLEEWINMEYDLDLIKDFNVIEDELLNTLKLAKLCVDPNPSARPEVKIVLQQLEKIRPETVTTSGDEGGGGGPSTSD